MIGKFTAKLYLGNKVYLENLGDDVDKLYLWLLTQANGKMGDLHGEIIDNTTQQIVKKFRKSPPE